MSEREFLAHPVYPLQYPKSMRNQSSGAACYGALGSAITKIQGRRYSLAWASLVDSGQTCPPAGPNSSLFLPESESLTCNGPDKHGTAPVTYGGYFRRRRRRG